MNTRKSKKKIILKDVPDVVYDFNSKRMFTKGRFLGKGGFARCYELIDNSTRINYAGKVVSKALLTEKHQKEKIAQEVNIHRYLSHPHVVKMHGCFEDLNNVYILLELCTRRSLMELHKRRKTVTEPEARYFTRQVADACEYLHSKKIIHRDLKLGNLFLNDEMQVKIGDFGLATTLEQEKDRKYTLCGTPNYIAPEMLDKRGHSFPVDVWAIGCVLYTLIVGKPPFETETLKETYERIKNNQYIIPSFVSKNASTLITKLLTSDPFKRPHITEVIKDLFFIEGYLPNRLPISCLTTAPKFNEIILENDKNAYQMSENDLCQRLTASQPFQLIEQNVNTKLQIPKKLSSSFMYTDKTSDEQVDYLQQLLKFIMLVEASNPSRFNEEDLVEIQDPASTPVYWISKWIDYSQKYGLGYQLCDNSVGIFFNDNTKIILDAAGEQIQYIEKNKVEHYYVSNNCPLVLEKKIMLTHHFRTFMTENLLKTGANIPKQEGDELIRLPYLNIWFRSKAVIVMHLSNGSLQVNFFQDHSKLIMCPVMGAVTYIDSNKLVSTFKFLLLKKYGCPKELWLRLKYSKTIIQRILSKDLSSKKSFQNVNN